MRVAAFLLLSALAVLAQNPLPIQSGATSSNAWLGGRFFSSFASLTNCCAGGTLTNLNSFSIPGNMLTNNGDTILVIASGRFSLTGQAKRLVVTYGSQDLLDTGLQLSSNGTWRITGFISRLPAGQYFNFQASWDRAVAGGGTNASGVVAQTNGIGTLFRLQGAANVVSSITNESLSGDYYPGLR